MDTSCSKENSGLTPGEKKNPQPTNESNQALERVAQKLVEFVFIDIKNQMNKIMNNLIKLQT